MTERTQRRLVTIAVIAAALTEHGRVVPTWDYVAVHAHGVARVVDDRDRLLDLLTRLTDAQEARQAVPWHVASVRRSGPGGRHRPR